MCILDQKIRKKYQRQEISVEQLNCLHDTWEGDPMHSPSLLPKGARNANPQNPRIFIGMGTCGIAAGAALVNETIRDYLKKNQIKAQIVPVGCIGLDDHEVLMDVQLPGQGRIAYSRVDPDKARTILEGHLVRGRPVKKWVLGEVQDPSLPFPEMEFFRRQRRTVLAYSGFINPESINDYLAYEGYSAFRKALEQYRPEEVIEMVKTAGLRGRGGGGFSTGRKWEFTRQAPGESKYIICNADEGDPGAFMDRSIMEGDPHRVLEGMLIGAYAIGAVHGYIYIRAEYPLAVRRIKIALAQARKNGLLGDNILGSGFSFDITVKEGAGAFVCGEETALMASIEGHRGMPRPRPPYPATNGLWAKPTNINNVETWANVRVIIEKGPDYYASLGTEKSKGTKVFALTGKIKRTGLVEVPMGITLREIIYDLGDGMIEGSHFKGVQIGGPSGGCLPEALLDTPVDYDSLTENGAMMGSGGMVVVDQSTCMVDFARYFMAFCRNEACGKCTPGREGTLRLLEILNRLVNFEADREDLDRLKSLALMMQDTALCGLCQTAPNPVLSTIRFFGGEYLAHVEEKRCPAGVCGRGKKEDGMVEYRKITH
jgi:NADH:ubiquinone oxidoreductase subunit F (NADH-binding)